MPQVLQWAIALVSGVLIGYGAALLLSFSGMLPHRWQPDVSPISDPTPEIEVIGIGWAGTRTPYFENTLTFFQDVLQIPIKIQFEEFAEFQLPSGDRLGISRANQWVNSTAKGPQFEFLVKDIQSAQATLAARGVQFLGEIQRDPNSGIAWVQFWGPDGYVYGLTSTPRSQSQ
jgi:predicted enzyme related to lactoylglutathione lyase